MKYMGSKTRIAKHIVPVIQKHIDDNDIKTYIEPFAGGMNIIDKISCRDRIAGDINEYLIALFRYLVYAGGELPPTITREEYARVRANKNDYEPWYVGAVGFLASFNGKFFGGYAQQGYDKGRLRDYYRESKDNILKQVAHLYGTLFVSGSYTRFSNFANAVIYCDIPYAGTTKYVQDFDHAMFFDWVRMMSATNIVIISERTAPDDFDIIWEGKALRSLNPSGKFHNVERLYTYTKK